MRRAAALLACAVAVVVAAPAYGAGPARPAVEVVELSGVIDRPNVEAVRAVIARAERGGARAVVVQIDSPGSLGAEATLDLVESILDSRVPVVTWVGPPGARAEQGAALVAVSGDVAAMAPGAVLGPAETLDLRARLPQSRDIRFLAGQVASLQHERKRLPGGRAFTADEAHRGGIIETVAVQLPDLLRAVDGRSARTRSGEHVLQTKPSGAAFVRFHKPAGWGRLLHSAAQPGLAYILLLAALAGIVFELFHPGSWPKRRHQTPRWWRPRWARFVFRTIGRVVLNVGILGLAAGVLSGYGLVQLGASWPAVLLIVAGIAAFCVDLRFAGLGVFTLAGFAALVAGSLLLFRGPWIHLNPWVLAIGIAGMTAFMLGAMTRVVRDLRAIARGELQVTDPTPH